jgi:hypothetical protein
MFWPNHFVNLAGIAVLLAMAWLQRPHRAI